MMRLRLGSILLGFCAGVATAVLAGALIYRAVAREKYEFGHHMGRIDGLGEAIEAIRAEYGVVESAQAGKCLFSLKTSDVVVVVVDGVNTIRVVP